MAKGSRKQDGPGENYQPGVPDPLLLRVTRILKGTAEFKDRFFPDHGELVKVIDILRSMGCISWSSDLRVVIP